LGPADLGRSDTDPLLVLKFGSSVLRAISDLPAVAGEIYRQRRQGYRVIAVVSALAGETDRLFGDASAAAGGIDCRGGADLVSLGEERAAALLRIACERIGLGATICRSEELGLEAEGPERDADFTRLHSWSLLRKLDQSGVVIVPGFVGIGRDGNRRLLGRGGSDLTAVVLGSELGAECVRLYKDVDGVFEHDPAKAPEARKFDEISYSDTLCVAGRLVHIKAVEHAARRGLPIEVEALGSGQPTRIGGASHLSTNRARPPRLRIALAGYGVVGQALAARLHGDPHFEIASILVRDVGRPRAVPPPAQLTASIGDFLQSDADVVVELLSCERTAAHICHEKLRRGVDIVTASKRLISGHHDQLGSDIEAGGARLSFSASVGGSMPLLETIARVGRQKPIGQVSGVLNGTVNFILQRLHAGISFDVATREARERGFAEADCEADLSGADAAAKLQIIAAAAFGVAPGKVDISTERLGHDVERLVHQSGERWIQLATVRRSRDGAEGSVLLCPLAGAGLPDVQDEWNIGLIQFADGGEITVRGRGAGGPATAEAVLADLYELLHGKAGPEPGLRQILTDRVQPILLGR
jgi:homoserine dehydrogenase